MDFENNPKDNSVILHNEQEYMQLESLVHESENI